MNSFFFVFTETPDWATMVNVTKADIDEQNDAMIEQQPLRRRPGPKLNIAFTKRLGKKTKEDLQSECLNGECFLDVSADKDGVHQMSSSCCGPFERIEEMLSIYKNIIDQDLWNANKMVDIIQIKGRYGQQQLFDDFMHVKLMHIDKSSDGNLGVDLCKYLQSKYACKNTNECTPSLRHRRDRSNDEEEQRLYGRHWAMDNEARDEEVTLQQLCDNIHSYFFQFGCSLCIYF